MRVAAAFALLVSGLACGSRPAGPTDGPLDASSVDVDAPNAGMLRVRVYSERWPGLLEPGARVLVARPGEQLEEVATGTDGVADVKAVPGTTVTVVQPAFLPSGVVGTAFATFVDLAAGMEIVAGPRRQRNHVLSTVRFVLPPYPGGHFYTVTTPCESLGAGEGTEGTLTVFGPCATVGAATVIGRVRDRGEHLLALSVLEQVDLLAADGTTITMPPFDVEPVQISATLHDVPPVLAGPFPHVDYRRGPDTNILATTATLPIVASQPDLVRTESAGYPVGDSSSLEVVFPHRDASGFARSDYHGHAAGAVTTFAVDAGAMIRRVYDDPTASSLGLTWREHPVGMPAELVATAVAWDDIRGVIVAPYAGTSLSFATLPEELQPTGAPQLWELHTWRVEGALYRDIVPLLAQSRDFRMWTLSLPIDLSWWRSSFVRAGLWPSSSVLPWETYRFLWDPAEDTYFRFASGEWIAAQVPRDGWYAQIDGFGHLTSFGNATSTEYHATTQVVDGPVRVRFDIEDVTGTVDLINETASWQVTGAVGFNVPGLVGESSCTTSPFTVSFRGNWRIGTDSEPFTIPALSGIDTQACSGRSAELNAKFALGHQGGLLHFYKFTVTPYDGPAFN